MDKVKKNNNNVIMHISNNCENSNNLIFGLSVFFFLSSKKTL